MKKLLFSLCLLVSLVGCGSPSQSNEKVIRIGASTTPHAEIIKFITPSLEEKGYDVQLTEFIDYNTPNSALLEGSIDVNYFQHLPYLEQWLKDAKQENKLKSVLAVHFEPLGIYSYTNKDLNVKENAKIAIPNDATNAGRSLQLLQAQGIIKLKEGVGITATTNDIIENKKQVEIVPMQAESCAKNLQDVDYAIVNGNNALNAKIQDKLIVNEDQKSEAANVFANIIVVQAGHEKDEKVQALIEVLNSKEVQDYINSTYNGIVVPLINGE